MEYNISFTNRKAKHDYLFIRGETAGICLEGLEIKSIKAGKLSFQDSFCFIKNNEIFIKNLYINSPEGLDSFVPNRERKLLLKKAEIVKIKRELIKGLTIVPYIIFINKRGLCKIQIFIAKGKKAPDKRLAIKEKDIKRNLERE